MRSSMNTEFLTPVIKGCFYALIYSFTVYLKVFHFVQFVYNYCYHLTRAHIYDWARICSCSVAAAVCARKHWLLFSCEKSSKFLNSRSGSPSHRIGIPNRRFTQENRRIYHPYLSPRTEKVNDVYSMHMLKVCPFVNRCIL